MVASIDLSGSQRHAGEVEGTAAVTAPRTRQHEKRNLSPVYRLSIARPDSKRAIRSLPPASTSPAEKTVLHHLQKAKSWQPTQRGLAFDVTISLSAPGKEAREAPANPLQQQRLPSTSEAVWCLALNRIGDVLRGVGASVQRASGHQIQLESVVLRQPTRDETKARNMAASPTHQSSCKRRLSGSWSRIRLKKSSRRRSPPTPASGCAAAVISDIEVLTHARKKRGTAPSSRLLPLPGLILRLPARQHHNNILFGACQGHQAR